MGRPYSSAHGRHPGPLGPELDPRGCARGIVPPWTHPFPRVMFGAPRIERLQDAIDNVLADDALAEGGTPIPLRQVITDTSEPAS